MMFFAANSTAEVAQVVRDRAPPPPMYENPPAPPAGEFRVTGHWRWTGERYEWVDGHNEKRRPGMRFRAPYWEQVGRDWVLREGGWR